MINDKFSETIKKYDSSMNFLKNSMILSYDGDMIFKTEETHNIKTDFRNRINKVLEEAFNKKYNRNTFQNIPFWFWIILLFFAHDNILSWIQSPLVMFFILVASVGFGYILATGRLSMLQSVFYLIKNHLFTLLLG